MGGKHKSGTCDARSSVLKFKMPLLLSLKGHANASTAVCFSNVSDQVKIKKVRRQLFHRGRLKAGSGGNAGPLRSGRKAAVTVCH